MDRILLEKHPPEAFIFPGTQGVLPTAVGFWPAVWGLWAALGAVKAPCGTLLQSLMGYPQSKACWHQGQPKPL